MRKAPESRSLPGFSFVPCRTGAFTMRPLPYFPNRYCWTSRQPRSSSRTARRFFPAICSSRSAIHPSAHATRMKVLRRHLFVRPRAVHRGPRRRIGRQPADKIHDPLARPAPVDAAVLLEDLRRGVQRRLVGVLLPDGPDIPRRDALDGLQNQPGAHLHEPFVHRADRILRADRHADLPDDGPLVDFVVQQEGRDAGFGLAVDDRPVDRRGTPVLGQQRGVEIEGPQPRHGPDHLGQHPEGDHDPQVGLPGPQCLDELRVAELHGLQDRKPQLPGGDLHVALVHPLPAAGGFVGCRDDPDDLVAPGDQRPQRRHGEFRRAHEDDAQLFSVHCHKSIRLDSRPGLQ